MFIGGLLLARYVLFLEPLTSCIHSCFYSLRDFPQLDGVVVFAPASEATRQGSHPDNPSLMEQQRRPGAG